MNNFLSISKKFADLEKSSSVILKVPYEMVTSYGTGTCKGPDAIISASAFVELFDEECCVKPHMLGISTQEVTGFSKDHSENLVLIGNEYAKFFDMGKFVIALGGEHSITIGIVRQLSKRIKDISVIQFDAHADMRSYYKKKYDTHASVMRRIYEVTPHVVQLGIRSLSSSENSFIESHKINTFYARDLFNMDTQEVLGDILAATTKNVYITFDVDFFSTHIIGDTGTPEPGGLDWYPTLSVLKGIFGAKNVVGADVVELIGRGGDGENVSAFSASVLVKKMLVYKYFRSMR